MLGEKMAEQASEKIPTSKIPAGSSTEPRPKRSLSDEYAIANKRRHASGDYNVAETANISRTSYAEHSGIGSARSSRRRSDHVTPQGSEMKTYLTPPVILENVELGEVPKSTPRRRSSGSGKRKIKRRSSFVRGRISKVAPVVSSSEISFEFPEDLSPEEKLSKLCSATLQYTLDKLVTEMPDIEGIHQFNIKGKDVGENCIKDLAGRDAFKMATSTDRFLLNPANETLARMIDELTTYMDRLKAEFDRWEEILQEHTAEAELTEKNCTEIMEHPVTEQPPTGFTVHELKLVTDKTNCNVYLNKLQGHRERTICGVDNLVSIVKLLRNLQNVANKRLDNYAEMIYKHTFGDDPIHDDPKQLIMNCLCYKD